MAELATIPTLLAVLASYLLVLWTSRGRRPNLVEFLFSGNSVALAISSGVGSLFSVSIACTALLSAGYLYGWQILFSSIAGTIVGTFVLLRLVKSSAVLAFKAQQRTSGAAGGASFLAMLTHSSGRSYPVGVAFVLILVYTFLLASELAVVRVTSASLISLEAPELLAVLVMLVGICFSYVFVGGYRAVLLTDHFQVMVIAGFFGMLCGEIDWSSIEWHLLSSSTESALQFHTRSNLFALHAASFVGSAGMIVGAADHWFRTLGTLPLREARRAIAASSVLGSVIGSLVVLAGTYFARLTSPVTPVAGQGSLELLASVVSMGSQSLTFMFFAALACVALTTIDTYMIAQQQLYYEFVSRFSARTAGSYLVEYVLRWRQVRFVGFLLVVAAFLLSLLVPSDKIYAVGVAALSTPIAFAPLLLVEAFGGARSIFRAVVRRPALAVASSFLLWLPTVSALAWAFGSVWSRLYLITLGLGLASLMGYLISAIAVLLNLGKEEREAT